MYFSLYIINRDDSSFSFVASKLSFFGNFFWYNSYFFGNFFYSPQCDFFGGCALVHASLPAHIFVFFFFFFFFLCDYLTGIWFYIFFYYFVYESRPLPSKYSNYVNMTSVLVSSPIFCFVRPFLLLSFYFSIYECCLLNFRFIYLFIF